MIQRKSQLAWLLLLGAAAGTFLSVYGRALSYPPVFDDFANVIENRAIRYLLHPRIFLESEACRNRPLPYLTFAISYWFSGLSLSGLRVPGLAFHLANATLLIFFYRRWFGGAASRFSWGALAAGALFLLHPLAADTVLYLSARGCVLVLFFVLLALACEGRERVTTASWLGFLLFGALAMLSRESAAALLPLALLVHWLSRRRTFELVPFLAPIFAGAVVLVALKARFIGAAYSGFFSVSADVDLTSFGDYVRLSLSLWPRILELFLNPAALAVDHSVVLPNSWFTPAIVGGALLWAGFGASLWVFFRRRSPWAFAVCWIFASLAPTNTVFPVLDPLSERHFYFALPGLALLFGLGVDALAARLGSVAGVAAVGAVLVLGDTVTLARVLDWRSGVALWQSAQTLAPNKFRIAFNLAAARITERGDREGALRTLATVLAKFPPGAVRFEEQTEATDFLAKELAAMAVGRAEEPRRIWEELGLPGGFWEELALLRADLPTQPLGLWEERWGQALARVRYTAVSPRARDPRWVESTFLLLRGEARAQAGQAAAALRDYESVILPLPHGHIPYWTARKPLGDLYFQLGREREAVAQYELAAYQYKVYKRFPRELQLRLYSYFRKQGDLLRATDAIGELVRVQVDDPSLRALYAELLRLQRHKHALQQSQEAAFYEKHAVRLEDEREIVRP